jgi:hypothetical protein
VTMSTQIDCCPRFGGSQILIDLVTGPRQA